MKKVLCVYHKVDLDGRCGLEVVKYNYIQQGIQIDEYPYNYGDFIDWEKIMTYDTIILVDVAFQPYNDGMVKLELLSKTKEVIWIDHHSSAIEAVKELGLKFNGLQVMKPKISACELAWIFFRSDEYVPKVVKYLSKYDSWEDSSNEIEWDKVLDFQYGMRYAYSVGGDVRKGFLPWDTFFRDYQTCNDNFNSIMKIGEAIRDYQRGQDRDTMRFMSYTVTWEGLRFLVCNRQPANSMLFESKVDPAKHDAVLTWAWTGKHYKITMYDALKTGIDLTTIATKYGGGGHKCACGCEFKELPKELLYGTK